MNESNGIWAWIPKLFFGKVKENLASKFGQSIIKNQEEIEGFGDINIYARFEGLGGILVIEEKCN